MLAAAGLFVGAPALAQVAESGIEPSQTQMNGWTINLKDADIRAYIDQMSQLTGQTFIVDPRVKGQVTVVSNATLDTEEVYQLFLSVMATHGYSVLSQGDVTRIVPNAEAKTEPGGGPTGGGSDTPSRSPRGATAARRAKVSGWTSSSATPHRNIDTTSRAYLFAVERLTPSLLTT